MRAPSLAALLLATLATALITSHTCTAAVAAAGVPTARSIAASAFTPLIPPLPPALSRVRWGRGLMSALRMGTRGASPGGVDFSSVAYTEMPADQVSSDGTGRPLEYLFRVPLDSGGSVGVSSDEAMEEWSDALVAWLDLPASTFWVNLNPNQPHRMLDRRLASTDAGLVLLESDFQLKRSVGQLIHPDSKLGRLFWDLSYNAVNNRAGNVCLSFRQWIVPGHIEVLHYNDALYVLRADLGVEQEREFFKLRDRGEPRDACPPNTDKEMALAAEKFFAKLVLPALIKQVNSAPEYAPLRHVFYWRVVAEWLRNHMPERIAAITAARASSVFAHTHTAAINAIFEQYVHSVTKGEFNVKRNVRARRGLVYERTYTHGGVAWQRVHGAAQCAWPPRLE